MLAEDRDRLEKIDKLYALRLDRSVSLPMLVVVGDQSSGKSSVLEGLTGLPFPRDSGLCTRFPTQVVFKRSAVKQIEVSVMPTESRTEHLSLDADKFHRKLDELDQDQFVEILSEVREFGGHNMISTLNTIQASKHMGIWAEEGTFDIASKSFSDDVLKIELSGPDHEHFSVVDLPGLFRKPTLGKTTKDDTTFVKKMVGDYIHNTRSIILAVVPANVDIATQEIVQMAEDADPTGRRTLGVLTKPDLVDKGAEDKVLELVLGSGGSFGLGYTMVCNRSQSNLDVCLAERNNLEKTFFQTEPWTNVPQDRAGISALKSRLNKLLVDLTRENFRDVAADVNQLIDNCHQMLQALGPERSSKTEQRGYLLRIGTSFQYLMSHALDAYYGRDAVFASHDELRLATVIKELQEEFSTTMRLAGHTRDFQRSQNGERIGANGVVNQAEPGDDSDLENSPGQGSRLLLVVDSERCSELRRTLSKFKKPMDTPRDNIDTWIRREYNRSKGFEIGTINPSLLPALYHEQMRYWRYHTMEHVDRVIEAVHSFIFSLLRHVCPDVAIRDRLWARLLGPLLLSYDKAIAHAKLLLEIEEVGNMRTLNHYFAVTLKKLRLSRMQKRLENSPSWHTQDEKQETLLRLKDVLNAYISNEDQAVEDLHDILQSYYKLARKQFVDAVSKGVVDYYLLTISDGPLRVCSPQLIGMLSDKELDEIAGENAESAAERARIMRRLMSLEAGQEAFST
ncbi:MAG: hypothetical protein L6R38_009355 [Xanthoria sp. 2 TBL-2021]|nr:MAG: hypothetical protein L6R38_009355 [Xanthoria sp. 2 TBL-2021]